MVGLAFEQKSALRARSSPRSYEPCRHETVYLLLIEETAMIVPLDDYIGHQTSASFAYPAASDPSWMERFWYFGYNVPAGDVGFMIGLGYHPSKNVLEAFALVTAGGVQHNFRGSRQINRTPLQTVLGPLEFSIVEAGKVHRLTMQENKSGIQFDLIFTGTTEPNEEDHHFRRSQGRIIEDSTRFAQNGQFSGWLESGGRRYDHSIGDWRAHRDHSWGIRRYLRTDENYPPITANAPMLYNWFLAELDGESIHTFVLEKSPGVYSVFSGDITGPLGDMKYKRIKLAGIEHDYEWADDPIGQQFLGGTMTLLLEGGGRRVLQIKVLEARVFHKGGGYGGLNGVFHGDDLGELHIAHDQWNLRDAGHRKVMKNLSEYALEVREGSKVGYGVIECVVGKGYPKYQIAQKFPTMF